VQDFDEYVLDKLMSSTYVGNARTCCRSTTPFRAITADNQTAGKKCHRGLKFSKVKMS
jgi:hypothetical protein